MDDILQCTICLENYNLTNKLPRVLKCGHTFCTLCLLKIKENTPLSCPIDRSISSCQEINEITINRTILDLINNNAFDIFEKMKHLTIKEDECKRRIFFDEQISKLHLRKQSMLYEIKLFYEGLHAEIDQLMRGVVSEVDEKIKAVEIDLILLREGKDYIIIFAFSVN